ncbi:hypothetical protein CEUSTIGMA_g7137.t1 [Chlamydomonas eustigma]|uniref:Phospholipid/glycerol acyltransferase domain-containing protein n=1 Tax=Chlamydomonas eustigma TaxID=1157962 RepID=A0A250X9F4_9CHLO|nr:hypothetical protein CEUSTIGMA_g7137.t1 [Chlamydomonas eustigma]|eukprot:GAX79696.1 hypothetical protein CEUSTIGMA_g7137.t1 [Chlamydomonas eustigma]
MIKSLCHKFLLKLHGSKDDALGQGQAQLYFAGYNHVAPYDDTLSRTAARFYDILRPSQPSGIRNAQPSSSESTKLLSSESNLLGHDGYFRRCILYVLAQASHGFMHMLNSTEVQGAEVMNKALMRPPGQALITVCNHVAALDDPLVMATVIPKDHFGKPENIRWTLCATDRCFKYTALVPFFRAAKVLPVQRGGGMRQPGMQAAEEQLRCGQWVHIFPEGTRSQGGGRMGPVRKGVGRLVVAACGETLPLVVPFVHNGMDEVMPRGKALPNIGKKVRVLVGPPIPVEDILNTARQQGWNEDKLYTALASRVSRHLTALKACLDAGGNAADLDLSSSSLAPSVSGLDLYDESDLMWFHRASMWEKAKFRMQHRAWRLTSTAPLSMSKQMPESCCDADPINNSVTDPAIRQPYGWHLSNPRHGHDDREDAGPSTPWAASVQSLKATFKIPSADSHIPALSTSIHNVLQCFAKEVLSLNHAAGTVQFGVVKYNKDRMEHMARIMAFPAAGM